MKVCFETFGCRLNKAEALQMEAEYLAKGWELTDVHSEADLFVVRGCSVTARAQYECERLISHLRHHYPKAQLRICGCLERKSRNVDAKEPIESDLIPMKTARAYLKVQDGCSGKCSFCIVPKFRGPSVSLPFARIVDKGNRFIEAGYHEIVVTGCNLSLYASGGKRLPDLLAALAELSPDCRIRLGSLEPGACAMETVRVFAEHANICRFLHIPVQSGSGNVLMSMKRPYRIRDVDRLVSTAVELLPGLGLGCDLMTGFPGESSLDFEASVGLLKRLPFNHAHVFPYSERPGTPAARFDGALPKSLRSKRAHKLAALINASRERFACTFLGKTVEIVSEARDKTVGWTSEYLKCEAEGTAPRKSLVRVQVIGVEGDQLKGRVVK